MIKYKYEKILDQFEINYRDYYMRAVDWWASGRMSIAVKLDNDEIIDYNYVENTIRWVRIDGIDNDERMRKAFGHNLQKFMPFIGMSKSELAERIGITNAMLSRYLHGDTIPSADKAHRIARIIGCSTDELFDDTYME